MKLKLFTLPGPAFVAANTVPAQIDVPPAKVAALKLFVVPLPMPPTVKVLVTEPLPAVTPFWKTPPLWLSSVPVR